MRLPFFNILTIMMGLLIVLSSCSEKKQMGITVEQEAIMIESGKVGKRLIEKLKVEEWVDVIVTFTTGPIEAAEAQPPTFLTKKSRDELKSIGDEILFSLKAGRVRVKRQYEYVNAFSLEVRVDGVIGLVNGERVKKINADHPNTFFLSEAKSVARFTQTESLGLSGDGVTVAIIDSGYTEGHSALGDSLVQGVCFDEEGGCPGDTEQFVGKSGVADEYGHGTHVAGIITSNGVIPSVSKGVAPDAGIVAIKVGHTFTIDNPCGEGTVTGAAISQQEVLDALGWIVANEGSFENLKVVNMSLGDSSVLYPGDCDTATSYTQACDGLFRILRGRGISVFVAAGNDGDTGGMAAPACVSSAISVAAVYDATDTCQYGVCNSESVGVNADDIACWTNVSATTDLFAPGARIHSTSNLGGVIDKAGTSQATPMVAGCAALLYEQNSGLSADDVEKALETSMKPNIDILGNEYPNLDCWSAVKSVLDNDGDGVMNMDDPCASDASNQCYVATFFDVSSSDWFARWVNVLEGMGIVEGYGDGTFRPENTVTRAEFMKMAVAMANTANVDGWSKYQSTTALNFSDTAEVDWWHEWLSIAVNNNVFTNPASSVPFNPHEGLSRGEAAEIVVKTFDLVQQSGAIDFPDVMSGNQYYSYIRTASSHKILEGYGSGVNEGMFVPDQTINRAEAAKIIYESYRANHG